MNRDRFIEKILLARLVVLAKILSLGMVQFSGSRPSTIRNIQKGKRYISNLVYTTVKEIILHGKGWNKPASSLTMRETVVLKLMAEGKSSREIADLLFISVPTVNRHRFNIKLKLALKSNADLIKYAIEKGYASLAHS